MNETSNTWERITVSLRQDENYWEKLSNELSFSGSLIIPTDRLSINGIKQMSKESDAPPVSFLIFKMN